MQEEEYEKMYQLEDTHWWFVSKRRLVHSFFKKNSSILDIGCGTGANLRSFSPYGKTVGMDVSPLAIKFSSMRNCPRLVRASVSDLPFKNDVFGIVTLLDILYHKMVNEDKKALDNVARIIKNGGKIIITDSALEFLRGPHDTAVHGVRRYTKARLKQLVKEAGFIIERLSYINFLLFPIICSIRLLKKGGTSSDLKPINPILNYILLQIQGFERFLLRFINLPIGSSILCVARKGALSQ